MKAKDKTGHVTNLRVGFSDVFGIDDDKVSSLSLRVYAHVLR